MKSDGWLHAQAQLHPKRPALYWENKSWSFHALHQLTKHYAAYYANYLPKDVKRVALLSKNSLSTYVSILALWELGKEIVFLNARLTREEWLYQLNDANCTVLLTDTDTKFADIVSFTVCGDEAPSQMTYLEDEIVRYQNDQIASIMYTSGTTGPPKGVPQRFENHLASAYATKDNLDITIDDIWGCAVPLYHISGLSILLRSLTLGIGVQLYSAFDADTMNCDIKKGRITVASVVSKMLKDLLNQVTEGDYPTSFSNFLLGGGPIDRATLEVCQKKKIRVIQSYGMTETCSQIVALSEKSAAQKLGASGIPIGQASLRINSPNHQGIGEIWVQGPSVATQYLGNINSAAWTKDGWFRTGDLGYLDEDNYLYVVSRANELIISGGENIYPNEVEAALIQHPAIKEVAVVGKEDPVWGQIVLAYLVLINQVTKKDIQSFITSKLAKYKQPKHYYIVHAIPHTASGKPMKKIFLTEQKEEFIQHELD